MVRTSILVAAIVALAAMSPVAGRAQQSSSPAEGQHAPGATHAPHEPMPKPVNLHVLPKDTSPEQLIKIMKSFTQQLGVECEFCHTQDAATKHINFASDEKPEKNVARTMISMTQEINARYLSTVHDPDATPAQKEVTCGTCHRGHNMPQVFTPPEHHPAAPHK
jgi:Photosynthetic reaction centre cytochrome C subunit